MDDIRPTVRDTNLHLKSRFSSLSPDHSSAILNLNIINNDSLRFNIQIPRYPTYLIQI